MTLAALPLVVPSYVAALSLIAATGPSGVLVEIPTPYGFVGSWLVLGVHCAAGPPHPHPGLRAIDPATEESATGLGASRWRVFVTVTLPQLKPALVSSGLLVGLYTISDFGAVSLLRYDTFTRAISAPPRADRSEAIGDLVVDPHGPGDRDPSHRAPIPCQGRPSLPPSPWARPLLSLTGWPRAASVLALALYTLVALGLPLAVMTITVIGGSRPIRSWGRSARRHFDRWGWRSSPRW